MKINGSCRVGDVPPSPWSAGSVANGLERLYGTDDDEEPVETSPAHLRQPIAGHGDGGASLTVAIRCFGGAPSLRRLSPHLNSSAPSNMKKHAGAPRLRAGFPKRRKPMNRKNLLRLALALAATAASSWLTPPAEAAFCLKRCGIDPANPDCCEVCCTKPNGTTTCRLVC